MIQVKSQESIYILYIYIYQRFSSSKIAFNNDLEGKKEKNRVRSQKGEENGRKNAKKLIQTRKPD
jgi:hypothetical protein